VTETGLIPWRAAAALAIAFAAPAQALAHEPLWGETPAIFGPGVFHPEIRIGLVRTGRDPGDAGSREIAQEYGLQYGINRFVNVRLKLPVTDLDMEEDVAGTTQKTRVSGLGDAMLEAKYRFYLRQEKGFQTAQALVVGWKFPTGADDRTAAGVRLDPGQQPGTGHHAVEVGYAFDRERLADSWWWSAFYGHELGSGFRTGDSGELDAAYGRWVVRPHVADELGVNLAMGVHAEIAASDRLDGNGELGNAHRVAGVQVTPIVTKGRSQYRVGVFVPLLRGGDEEETDFGYEIRAGWEMFF
jgi:Putative MetA-pathway of phenol degradation